MPQQNTPQHSPKDQKLKEKTAPDAPYTVLKHNKFAAFLQTKKGRILTGVVGAVVLLGIVFGIPASRYAIAGLVIKKDVVVAVHDAKSNKPVSGAHISLDGKTATTGADGTAKISQIPVGAWEIKVSKQYYKDISVTQTVGIFADTSKTLGTVALTATGRVTPVAITNKITSAAIKDATITVGGTSTITGNDGTADIVLPANQATVSATIKAGGYNQLQASITVTEQKDTHNTFTLTPTGKIYFLSKRTGVINVMKSDLDGSNQTVAVSGTGKESDTDTILLASRDWKYLALQASREESKTKLYLIDTSTDKLTTIDEGEDVTFTPVGWSNHHFIYRVSRTNLQNWDAKRESIKSFDATNGHITMLDDTDAVGNSPTNWAHETYSSVYIIGDTISYGKYWDNYYSAALLGGKKEGIYSVNADGSNKQTLKDFDATAFSFIEAQLYRPDEIYYRVIPNGSGTSQFFELDDGKVNTTTDVNDNNFFQPAYNTYLVSPSGNKTFWSESRDGKNVMLVGDASGENGKELTTDGTFATYGWFSDDYVLLSKNGSELYIMPSDPKIKQAPLKITDYHKPARSFPGYGYGYGGGN